MRQRTHLGAVVQAVADLDRADHLGKARQELVIRLFLDVEARRRYAHLAGVAQLEARQHLGRRLDIGIVEYQHRRVAAQLHGHALHMRAGQRRQLLAHRHRAGERDLAHDRRFDQVGRYFAGHAPDDIQHPRRQAGIMEQPGQRHHRAGRVLRALQDQRAARAHRGNDLADRLVEREVPRRECGADPDRLAHHDLPHIGLARRNHAAVDAAAFLGVPVGVLGADHHFAHGFGQRLALVQRDIAADLLGALAGQLAHAAQDLAALQRRGLLPRLERALRSGERAVQVGAGRVRQLAQHFLGGRIDDVLLAPVASLDEFTVDIEGEILVHACSPGGR
ncbi:hypothetical protein D3C72_1221640 [compost metagenome]